jgi:SAM-dependent methyltransferase
MIEQKKYSRRFFDELQATSLKSAEVVLPIIKQVINPHSVIDIGCGTGEWLKVWKEELGVLQVKGVEGPYIDPASFAISSEYLVTHDLKDPYIEDKKYDLAMSLEVGEHLPEDKADVLVQSLTRLSDVVLFSAAIPGQEGTYHINLQYPEYWAALFSKEGFETVDFIRREIWNLPEVEYWYKQNILLFIRKEKLNEFPYLKINSEKVDKLYLTRIHPDLLELKNKHIKETNTLLGYMNWKWVVFKYKYLKRKEMKNA